MDIKFLIKVPVCLLLAAALVFMIAMPVAANGARNWYLDSLNHAASGKVMEMTRGGQSGSISIISGKTQYWLADQAAAHDVTFSDGAWVIGLTIDGSWSSNQALIVLGEWDTANQKFIAFSTSTQFQGNTDQLLNVQLQSGPVTVHYGNYLALAVTNQDSSNHTIITDGSSFLESPSSNPGYPLPEATSLVLLAGGLLGLAGYTIFTRKKGMRQNTGYKV